MRVVDTREPAEKTYEVFYARSHEREVRVPGWPERMQEVGAGAAEMYRSNKWKKSRKDFEDYKHVPGLEGGSRKLFVVPGFLRFVDEKMRPVHRPVVGPMVELTDPMPKHFARLGQLLGVQAQLYKAGKSGPELPKGDENYIEIAVAHGWLGAATHPTTKEPFLFVYTERDGVVMLLTGPKLAIGKDGIER